MVNRTSVRDASRRVQTHASRATLRELNSKPYWAEAKQLDIMANETATDVEYAEGYGATGVPAKQDPEDDDQKGGESSQASAGGDQAARAAPKARRASSRRATPPRPSSSI